MDKRPKETFPQQEHSMATKHMKRCLTSPEVMKPTRAHPPGAQQATKRPTWSFCREEREVIS